MTEPPADPTAPTDGTAASGELLTLSGVTKAFDGVPVLRGVDLTLNRGEVRGFVGVNGSGKSTLIKILAGYHEADGGRLAFEGPASVAEGCAFVHQELGLVDSLSATENMALGVGYRTGRFGQVSWSEQRRATRKALEEYGVECDIDRPVGELGSSERALLTIARAIARLPRTGGVLVLDEPTAALPVDEIDRVLAVITRFAAAGSAVLFVTHNLPEIFRVCDSVSVLREGRIVDELDCGSSSPDQTLECMLGRPLEAAVATAPRQQATDAVLAVNGLRGRTVRDVDLQVEAGEIVGVTGLLGSGKSELARLICGLEKPDAGTVTVRGKGFATGSPRAAIDAGIGYVPPERRTHGGIAEFDARENLTLPDLSEFWHGLRLHRRQERDQSVDWMRQCQVSPPDPERLFSRFSGGNQQKLVFAKVLRMKPQILVFDEPTQGVDAGAIPGLYRLVTAAAAAGCAVLIMSGDWEELARVCHRVLVFERGRVRSSLADTELSADALAAAVLGAGGERTTPEATEALVP